MNRLTRFAILLCAVAATAAADSLVLPQTTVYGEPGDTVGFGFTITSTPDFGFDNGMIAYLVITSAEFLDDHGIDPVGVFTPYISQNFVVVGPNDAFGDANPYSQDFSIANQTGIGAYQIDNFQPVGAMVSGRIVLTFDEYSVSPNDPSFDPIADGLAFGQVISARAQVVVGPAPVTTPEPATWLAWLSAVLLLFRSRRMLAPGHWLQRTAVTKAAGAIGKSE